MFIFMSLITLLQVGLVYLEQNATSKQCTSPMLRDDPTKYDLPPFLQDKKPDNWNKILDVVGAIGTPLHDWRESEHICIRGENTIISRQSIHCFKVKQITNITRKLHDIYQEANDYYAIPNLKVLDVLSKSIDKFEIIDYYILLKIVEITPDQISAEKLVNFMNIVRNVLYSKFGKHKVFVILNKLTSILYNSKRDFVIINPDFALTLWHPFKSNISGYGLYDNLNYTALIMKPIFKNQSIQDIDKKDLKMAGFIPDEFLESITKDVPLKKKQRLYVQMLFVSVCEKFSKFFKPTHTYHSLIGISIPRFCKTNHLPLLKAYFADNSTKESNWVSLGQKFTDSSEYEDSELCLLDRMTFFGAKEDGTAQHILHQKCDPISITTNTTNIKFQQRKHDFMLHPQELCLNRKLEIPTLICHEGLVIDTGDSEINCFEHPTSNQTENIYKRLMECYSGEKCARIPNLLDDIDLTYSDIKLYFLLLRQIKIRHQYSLEPLESLLNVLERGLVLVQKQAGETEKATYLADFITSFLNCLPQNFDHNLFRRSNFVYRTIEPISAQATYGLVLYKGLNNSFEDCQIETLTLSNLTRTDYACDEDVEVVIMLLDESKEFSEISGAIFHIFIVDNAQMAKDENYYSGSKIIGIEYVSYYNHKKMFKFAVFLRTNWNNVGYWSVINAESHIMSVAYVPVGKARFRSFGNKIKSFKYIL